MVEHERGQKSFFKVQVVMDFPWFNFKCGVLVPQDCRQSMFACATTYCARSTAHCGTEGNFVPNLNSLLLSMKMQIFKILKNNHIGSMSDIQNLDKINNLPQCVQYTVKN